MAPRQFEEFCAALLSRVGFEVELTKATRDGGADLLCISRLGDIPIKMAVEIKRYKESRPITVSMVRSFVGANAEFKANKLVYLTTSSYTAPAKAYATDCVGHLLSLKQYDQIQEWCKSALRQG